MNLPTADACNTRFCGMTTFSTADASAALSASDGRPEFIARLGLLLPCTPADVESAYRDRAKAAHPDAGGSTAEFTQLQADYEAALEYARYHSGRRGWLAANVERYSATQAVIAEIERLGGTVETERPAWIAREIGDDFAQLLDTVTGVRLTGLPVGPKEVAYLAGQRDVLAGLHRLDLSDSRVDDLAVKRLSVFPTLHDLDLRGTNVGDRTAAELAEMSALRRVNLADTFVSWLGRLRLRRRRPKLEIVTSRSGTTNNKRWYRWLLRALAVYFVAMVASTHAPPEPEFLPDIDWPGADKLAHLGIFCGLSFLLALVVFMRKVHRGLCACLSRAQYAGIAAGVAVYAALDELTQPWTGRDSNFWDWIADMAGMALGLALFALIERYSLRRREVVIGPPE
jgi:VanZ family protein